MESLQDILKSHHPLSGKSKDLENIKKILIESGLTFHSIRLNKAELLITVASHIEATHVRYQSPKLINLINTKTGITLKRITTKSL